MRKGIVILVPLVLAIASAVALVPKVKAATVIIHDDPTQPVSVTKPKGECLEVINASAGMRGGSITTPPYVIGNLWLRSSSGFVTVNSTIACRTLYIQYHWSDSNDGVTDIYVDDMVNPVARIDTYERKDWYVEIRGLSNTPHTVRVKSSGNSNMTGVTPSPHRTTPGLGDNDVWYFCFAPPGIGGTTSHVPNSGLLAPYIGLTSAIIVAVVAAFAYVKRAKGRDEKH